MLVQSIIIENLFNFMFVRGYIYLFVIFFFRKGSVIANFSVVYNHVRTDEILLIQHHMNEYKKINNMSIADYRIVTDNSCKC